MDEEVEANLDTQWSSAIAKGATIDLVVSASTETAAGIDLSAEYIVDNNLAPVMSTSYGECEFALGVAGNAFYNALYQQAAAQGITVLTSSGDNGAAGCDIEGSPIAEDGLQVSGLTSTPYNVSVGGTDFYMPGNAGNYWNATNTATTEASVQGYIPESAWNISCANPAWTALTEFSGLTPEQVCNDFAAGDSLQNIVATGGGASSCTQSDGTNLSTCTAPYAKPSWQAGPGVPPDGARDVPDVSLFAASGVASTFFFKNTLFNSFYIVCQQDVLPNGPCNLNTQTFSFLGVGGTSASSPAFAGIMALVNQKTGERQGNANYVFYRLAAQQDPSNCNSANGSGSACIFNDVTIGSNEVPCGLNRPNCIQTNPNDPYAVLSSYLTTSGYDQTTGLGSVNIANLVNGWNTASFAATTTTLQLNPLTAVHGSGITATATVTSGTGTPTGNVSINGSTVNGSVGEGALANGVITKVFNNLPGGSYSVQAHYAGDGSHAESDSAPVSVTVSPETSTEQIVVKTYDQNTGAFDTVTSAQYGSLFLIRANIAGASGFGTPTGSATLALDGQPLDAGTYQLNGEGAVEGQTINLLGGPHTITATYAGDVSFKASSLSNPFIVTPMAMSCQQLFLNTTVLRPGWNLDLTLYANAAPNTSIYGYVPNGTTLPPTGTISFYSGASLLAGPLPVTGTGGAVLPPTGAANNYSLPSATAFAVVQASQLPNPLQPITAVYSGESNHASCTSSPITVTYDSSPIVSTTNWMSSSSQSLFSGEGGTGTVTVSVTAPFPVPGEPAYTLPTGTVRLMIDGLAVGTPASLGTNYPASASLPVTTSSLAAGTHTIVFSYSGDFQYAPSQSTYSFTLIGPDFAFSQSYLDASVINGATTAPVSIQVTPLNGFTGTVNFSCSGLPRGATCNFAPSSVNGGGSTALTISTTKASERPGRPVSNNHRPLTPWFPLGAGIVSGGFLIWCLPFPRPRFSAFLFAGICGIVLATTTSCSSTGTSTTDGNNGTLQGTTTTLAATALAPAEGASDTFTATISGGSGQPTGTVQFSVNSAPSGAPVALTGSTAMFTTSFSVPGFYSVGAKYSGDSVFYSSTSNLISVNVPYAVGTAPGLYTVTVSGQSETLNHTLQISLVVQ